MEAVCIINTGGTFNKIYNQINGNLEIEPNNEIIKKILNSSFAHLNHISLEGIIFKDSLEFNAEDRALLVDTIKQVKQNKIIVIHGTDTMDQSAEFVSAHIEDKCVIFVGAMKPFSIDHIEATANLSLALGYIQNAPQGIYISMQGLIKPYNLLKKNRETGIFNVIN